MPRAITMPEETGGRPVKVYQREDVWPHLKDAYWQKKHHEDRRKAEEGYMFQRKDVVVIISTGELAHLTSHPSKMGHGAHRSIRGKEVVRVSVEDAYIETLQGMSRGTTNKNTLISDIRHATDSDIRRTKRGVDFEL